MAEERFLKRAVLDTIVPHASEVDLEDALSSGLRVDSDDSLSLSSSIRQRDLLFFGMSHGRGRSPARPSSYSFSG